jgi:hypothetical protein
MECFVPVFRIALVCLLAGLTLHCGSSGRTTETDGGTPAEDGSGPARDAAAQPDAGGRLDGRVPEDGAATDAGGRLDGRVPEDGAATDAGSTPDAGPSTDGGPATDGGSVDGGPSGGDCDAGTGEGCVCPLLTHECAAGCCELESEQVSQGHADHPALALDEDGNLYAAYSILGSGSRDSGMAVHTRATSSWSHFTYPVGSTRSQIAIASTGRVYHQYAGAIDDRIHVVYSDDQGSSWSAMPDIPRRLDIGESCSMALDSGGRPHLLCGLDTSTAHSGVPHLIEWTGSEWELEELPLDDTHVYTSAHLRIGFMDRPRIVHGNGPTDTDLHYSYYTGNQWVTEEVPLPEGLSVHPDVRPGVALDDDTLHLAFIAAEEDFAAWYGKRTATGSWTFEEAIPPADLGGGDYTSCVLELLPSGQPVLFTRFGSGARRTGSDSWQHFAVDHPVSALALRDGLAHVLYPTDTGNRALHLDLVDLFP